jgi:hypothetical protein
MPWCSATILPSRRLSDEESYSGNNTPNTLPAPNAFTHNAEVTELSMPPDRATTTPRLRALRAKVRSEPVIFSTAASLSKARITSLRMSFTGGDSGAGFLR